MQMLRSVINLAGRKGLTAVRSAQVTALDACPSKIRNGFNVNAISDQRECRIK